MHYSGAVVTTDRRYRAWARQFNHWVDPATLVDIEKQKKKEMKRRRDLLATEQAAAQGGEDLLRPVHIMVGRDNAGLQSAFLASTIFTRKLNAMYPSVFTPLSVLQRKGES